MRIMHDKSFSNSKTKWHSNLPAVNQCISCEHSCHPILSTTMIMAFIFSGSRTNGILLFFMYIKKMYLDYLVQKSNGILELHFPKLGQRGLSNIVSWSETLHSHSHVQWVFQQVVVCYTKLLINLILLLKYLF